jgi:hypothetical protein
MQEEELEITHHPITLVLAVGVLVELDKTAKVQPIVVEVVMGYIMVINLDSKIQMETHLQHRDGFLVVEVEVQVHPVDWVVEQRVVSVEVQEMVVRV